MKDLIDARIKARREELFHERAQLDPRYTSPEHGISLEEYAPVYDSELIEFAIRLETETAKFIRNFK